MCIFSLLYDAPEPLGSIKYLMTCANYKAHFQKSIFCFARKTRCKYDWLVLLNYDQRNVFTCWMTNLIVFCKYNQIKCWDRISKKSSHIGNIHYLFSKPPPLWLAHSHCLHLFPIVSLIGLCIAFSKYIKRYHVYYQVSSVLSSC